MKRSQNLIIILAVAMLVALPLWIVRKPAPVVGAREVQVFTGTDDKARDLVKTIDPSYKPWFTPLMEPPSSDIGSLLFALQAAIGAGFLGYWYGCSKTRAECNQTLKTAPKC